MFLFRQFSYLWHSFMTTSKGISILLFLFIVVSCSVEKATIPSYLYINKFKLETVNTPTFQGDTSSDILDVWLYQNGEFIGSYGLPTYIPIIEKSKKNLTLRGGVKRSGQDDQRLQYQLYDDYNITVELKELANDTIKPVVKYLTNCKFPIVQDFDGSLSFFSIYNAKAGDTVTFVNDNTAWKLGNNSAKINFSDSTSKIDYISKELSNLPANNIPLFLEVDYNSKNTFDIGLNVIYTNGESRAYSVYSPNSSGGSWKKAYVDLATEVGSEIAQRGTGTKFQIFFRVQRNAQSGLDDTQLLLDNIKLIHL